MATATAVSPRDVSTVLNYYQAIGTEAPYYYREQPKDGKPITNVTSDPHPAVVHDARGKEHELTLDNAGFQFVRHVSKVKDVLDDEQIKEYYKEVEELLKKEVGAKRVFIFDHTIRYVS